MSKSVKRFQSSTSSVRNQLRGLSTFCCRTLLVLRSTLLRSQQSVSVQLVLPAVQFESKPVQLQCSDFAELQFFFNE